MVATNKAKLQHDGLAGRYREVDVGRAYRLTPGCTIVYLVDTFTEQEPEGGNRLCVDYELDLGHVGLRHPKRSPGRDITGGGEKLRKEAELGRARLVLEIKSGFSTLAAQDYV